MNLSVTNYFFFFFILPGAFYHLVLLSVINLMALMFVLFRIYSECKAQTLLVCFVFFLFDTIAETACRLLLKSVVLFRGYNKYFGALKFYIVAVKRGKLSCLIPIHIHSFIKMSQKNLKACISIFVCS